MESKQQSKCTQASPLVHYHDKDGVRELSVGKKKNYLPNVDGSKFWKRLNKTKIFYLTYY